MPSDLATQVTPQTLEAWNTLSTYDRRHLLDVAMDLERQGVDYDVVLAGLLHDIGKPANTSLPARVAVVLLQKLAPRLIVRLRSTSSPPPGLKQLHLLLNHANRGADLLAEYGEPERVVWLVRHHEDEQPADQGLITLQRADNHH